MMAICYRNAIFDAQIIMIAGMPYPEKIDASILQKDRNIIVAKFGVDEGYLVTRGQKRLDFFKTPP